VGLRKLWSISSWAPQHHKFENPCINKPALVHISWYLDLQHNIYNGGESL